MTASSSSDVTDLDDAAHTATWQAAAVRCAARVTVVTVGGQLADPTGAWAAIRGTDPTGAVLVRPDRHVAWRAAGVPADPTAELQSVVDRLLRQPMSGSADVRSALAGTVEAGEALRVTSARAPQLFSVARVTSSTPVAPSKGTPWPRSSSGPARRTVRCSPLRRACGPSEPTRTAPTPRSTTTPV